LDNPRCYIKPRMSPCKDRWRSKKSLCVWPFFIIVHTVLVLFNIDKICSCVAVPVNWFFVIISSISAKFRRLYIVMSLVRRRVTQRFTKLQTMCNVLKYRKILLNVALPLWCGCVEFFNLLKISRGSFTVSGIKLDFFPNWQNFASTCIFH